MACFKVLSRYSRQDKTTTESYDGVFRDLNQAPPKSAVLPPEPVFNFIICVDKRKLCHCFVIGAAYTVRA
jgi:hypothetical protein